MVKIKTFRNIANKSALSYIACYARSGFDYVYLQRGYRNYGIPQVLCNSLSLSFFKPWRRSNLVWIIRLISRDYANANARFAQIEAIIQLEIVSSLAYRLNNSTPSFLEKTLRIIMNVAVTAISVKVAQQSIGIQSWTACFIATKAIIILISWSEH